MADSLSFDLAMCDPRPVSIIRTIVQIICERKKTPALRAGVLYYCDAEGLVDFGQFPDGRSGSFAIRFRLGPFQNFEVFLQKSFAMRAILRVRPQDLPHDQPVGEDQEMLGGPLRLKIGRQFPGLDRVFDQSRPESELLLETAILMFPQFGVSGAGGGIVHPEAPKPIVRRPEDMAEGKDFELRQWRGTGLLL
nr:hypothetical protein [Bradyrhizobium sp. KBS0725]